MRMRSRRGLVLAAFTALACLLVVLSQDRAPDGVAVAAAENEANQLTEVPGVTAARLAAVPEPNDASARAAREDVAPLLPGARVSLDRDPMVPAHYLRIDLQDTALTVPGTDATLAGIAARQRGSATKDQVILATAALGWRAHMAAAIAATKNPAIARYHAAVSESAVPIPPEVQNMLLGTIRGEAAAPIEPRRPKLGSIDADQVQAQTKANIASIRSALPHGMFRGASSEILDVDKSTGALAVEIVLRVTDLAELADYYGDLWDGPTNGLIGSDDALVDGVGVVVRDDRGRQISTWRTERSVSGYDTWSTALDMPNSLTLKGEYVNLTNGPSVQPMRVRVQGPDGRDVEARRPSMERAEP